MIYTIIYTCGFLAGARENGSQKTPLLPFLNTLKNKKVKVQKKNPRPERTQPQLYSQAAVLL